MLREAGAAVSMTAVIIITVLAFCSTLVSGVPVITGRSIFTTIVLKK